MGNNVLEELSWYRLQTELLNTRLISSAHAHSVSVFEAIIKGTSNSANHNSLVVFHIKNRGHTFKLRGLRLHPFLCWVARFIEDFFPSVNLGILKMLIEHYIPSKDIVTRTTINKLLLNGYIESGTSYQRTKGLAQGSPLSPLFANLYLDTFDEQIAVMNLKLIRYADDFVILTKSKQEAQEALLKTESFLSDLGLRLKKEKSSIKSVFDGFEFLGIRFEKGEVTVKSEEEIMQH